ncbi:MAG: ATP-binding protein [bacterium]
MFNQNTIDKLNNLKLYGMARAFQEHIENLRYNELSFEERFGMIVDKEMTTKENRRLTTLLRKARLKQSQAAIEDIDFKADRGLLREQIITLSRGEWIKHKQNIILNIHSSYFCIRVFYIYYSGHYSREEDVSCFF